VLNDSPNDEATTAQLLQIFKERYGVAQAAD
jgi:hypothetical protein